MGDDEKIDTAAKTGSPCHKPRSGQRVTVRRFGGQVGKVPGRRHIIRHAPPPLAAVSRAARTVVRLHGRPMVVTGTKPGRGAGTACPARGRGGANPSSGCRGAKAACSSSRARKLWSWVPGRESRRRVVKGAIALAWVSRGRDAPGWCREAKPPSWVAGSTKAPRTGPRAVKALVGRDATGGRSAALAKPAPPMGRGGRVPRPWLAAASNAYFRIPRQAWRHGVPQYAATAFPCR